VSGLRAQRLQEIDRQLEGHRLIWVGTRGTDANPLLDLDSFAACFSLIAPMHSGSLEREVCLETISRHRVNLDQYDFDKDRSPEARELRAGLRSFLQEPSVIIPYRPLRFLSSISFTDSGMVRYFGLFHERQAPFEHKPWVESELKAQGVPVIPWTYYAYEDVQRLADNVRTQPMVIRLNRSSGGTGLQLVRSPAELETGIQSDVDGFLGASPFLDPNIPLNVNACVYSGGSVSIHRPSLQLIGIPQCTRLLFGYCGNDFAAVQALGPDLLDQLEDVVRRVGGWLGRMGYRGAFGVDAVEHRGQILVSEVNPRFQGSSEVSARIDAELGLPDLYMDHLSSYLGLAPIPTPPLRDLVRMHHGYSQVLFHNLLNHDVPGFTPASSGLLHEAEVVLSAAPDVTIAPGAIRWRLILPKLATRDGHELLPQVGALAGLLESEIIP
jgi:hypothetical protein